MPDLVRVFMLSHNLYVRILHKFWCCSTWEEMAWSRARKITMHLPKIQLRCLISPPLSRVTVVISCFRLCKVTHNYKGVLLEIPSLFSGIDGVREMNCSCPGFVLSTKAICCCLFNVIFFPDLLWQKWAKCNKHLWESVNSPSENCPTVY